MTPQSFCSYLFLLVYVAAIIAKPSPYRALYMVPLIALYTYAVFFTQPTGDAHSDYYIGLNMSIPLAYASSYIFLSDPQLYLRRKGQKELAYQMPFIPRLRWATDLAFNCRAVGWDCELPKLRRSLLSRWPFVRTQLLWLVYYYAMNDLASYLNSRNPATWKESDEHFGTHGFLWQIWNVMLFWGTVIAHMSVNYTLLSIIMVAIGWYDPSDFPAYFGRWLDTVSVRKFWGQSWHQLIRRSLQPHGQYLARNIFGFQKGTTLSSYTQLFACFFLSGVYHAAGDWTLAHNVDIAKHTMQFYMLQAMAITFEDGVIAVAKRFGVRRVPLLPYLWVIFWLTISTPVWATGMARGGLGDFPPRFPIIPTIIKKFNAA
ncbi:membrane bound O-acyl transferase family-domain-containing protein [Crucibulum laeve]|uniref:Membrane bound O-acyl transferase family-domain-containing protein n=1 Tax=Crucibulum laeve TaxID=68775 RepID=A0A5C3M2G0_9AGAR|nr:membrane bound O-acyl transferase family-domain-containing protein [Crucibulum laeve]